MRVYNGSAWVNAAFDVSGALINTNNLSDVSSAATALTNLGVNATAAEINLIDGGTARGTTAVADGDGVLVNDAGTMRMTNVQTVKTYMTAGVGGGAMEFIASSGALSNAANVSFTQFDSSKYDYYKFNFLYVKPVTDNVFLQAFISTDGGSSYDTTASNYCYGGSTNSANGFNLHAYASAGNNTNEYGLSGYLNILGPHLTTYTYGISEICVMYTDGSVYMGNTAADRGTAHKVAADVDAMKFQFSTGNITSGEIVMYGIKNA